MKKGYYALSTEERSELKKFFDEIVEKYCLGDYDIPPKFPKEWQKIIKSSKSMSKEYKKKGMYSMPEQCFLINYLGIAKVGREEYSVVAKEFYDLDAGYLDRLERFMLLVKKNKNISDKTEKSNDIQTDNEKLHVDNTQDYNKSKDYTNGTHYILTCNNDRFDDFNRRRYQIQYNMKDGQITSINITDKNNNYETTSFDKNSENFNDLKHRILYYKDDISNNVKINDLIGAFIDREKKQKENKPLKNGINEFQTSNDNCKINCIVANDKIKSIEVIDQNGCGKSFTCEGWVDNVVNNEVKESYNKDRDGIFLKLRDAILNDRSKLKNVSFVNEIVKSCDERQRRYNNKKMINLNNQYSNTNHL